VPYYADYPLNVWDGSTYQQIITKGLSVNPAHNPTILQNGETVAWNAFGKGIVAVIPVHTGNGWLNFTAIVPGWWDCGVGILLQNGTDGICHWLAISVGFNGSFVFGYGLLEPPSTTSSWYNFTATNTPWGAYVNTLTIRVAIHFQEGQPAKLYVWWLNDSQWVPAKMYTWPPNAVGDIAGYSYSQILWFYGNGGWAAGSPSPVYWNSSLVITSFPVYVYSVYATPPHYPGVGYYVYTYYILAPIDLVPGSNVIIVPGSGGAFVYNITTTI